MQSKYATIALKKLIFGILVALLLQASYGTSLTAEAAPVVNYNDLETATSALPYIQYLTDLGVINGFPDGSFRPWAAVTRAQLVKILVLSLEMELDQAGQVNFPDVPVQHWAYPFLQTAAAAGLVNGYPDGTFRPDAVVTRAEQAAMLFSFARYPVAFVPAVELEDLQPGHWAYGAVAAAMDAGLMGAVEGKKFMPDGASSRAGVSRNVALLTTLLPHNQVGVLGARLRPLEGQVTVTGKSGTQLVQGEIIIGVGDRIVTGAASRAEIEFDDGTGLRLEPDTEVAIINGLGSAFITPAGQPGTAINLLELQLTRGRMIGALASRTPAPAASPQQTASLFNSFPGGQWPPILLASTAPVPLDNSWYQQLAYVPPGMNAEEWEELPWWRQPFTRRVKVKVDMPWGVAGIRGTFWQNSVEAGRQSTQVLWGEAEVTAAGKTVPVATGQHTEVTSQAEPPAPPRKITVTEAKFWQEVGQWVVDQAVKIEQKAPAKPATDPILDIPVAPETVQQQSSPPPPVIVPPAPPLPLPGQPQQPAPGQPQPTGGSGSLLKDLLEQALTGVGAELPGETQTTGGSGSTGGGDSGGGGGDDGPQLPTISLSQMPTTIDTSFVRLTGTAGPVNLLKTLQVLLNGQLVGSISVVNGSFDYLLHNLVLGANQIELQAIDHQNRVTRVYRNIQRTTSYLIPQAAIQPHTGSISGSAAGPVNLEWRINGQVQGGTVFYPSNGIYQGMLPVMEGAAAGYLPAGELFLATPGPGPATQLQLYPVVTKLEPSGEVNGYVLGGAGERVELLWYRQRHPAALENLPLNAGIIPDARLEVTLDTTGNFSADLVAQGLPLQSGDVVAALYPANAPVRTVVAGPVVIGPQLLYTNYGITAVLPSGGSQAEIRLVKANNNQLAVLPVQADPAGYVNVPWVELYQSSLMDGDRLQLALPDGSQLEMPVKTLQVTPGWQQGQLTLAVQGDPLRPVWFQPDGTEPFWKQTNTAGQMAISLPVPQAWSWQTEWEPRIKVVQQVGPGLYRGVQVDLGVVPGVELDLEQSTALWWAGQGTSMQVTMPETEDQQGIPGGNIREAVTGSATLRQELGLQVGNNQYGTVKDLEAELSYLPVYPGNDIGLALTGKVVQGQQVLIELGNGSTINPGMWRSAAAVGADGSFAIPLPAGWQPDWVRIWAMDAGGYRAYRELYPWALKVDQDSGLIQGRHRQAGSDLSVNVIPPGASQPYWQIPVQAGADGFWQSFVPDGIPVGSEIQVVEGNQLVIATVAVLRNAYLDHELDELGASRLSPPRAVLARVDGSGNWWRLPAIDVNLYRWSYYPLLQVEPGGGQHPRVVMATLAPGGHRFQRQAGTLGMKVLLNQGRVEALVNSTAATAQLQWRRSGALIWSGQVAVERAEGLDRAVFYLPGSLQAGDVLDLNGHYSLELPTINVNADSYSGTVDGSVSIGEEPVAGGTVEVALVTYDGRSSTLVVINAGEFSATFSPGAYGEALEVTYITARGHRVTLRWEPGEW